MTKPRRDNDTLNRASAQDFERGIMATQVARKCNVLDSAADRELLWWLQFLSWQDGGLDALATELVNRYPSRILSSEMAEIGLKPGMICNTEQVKKIRGKPGAGRFLLRGEVDTYQWGIREVEETYFDSESRRDEARQKAKNHPVTYPAEAFWRLATIKLSGN